MAIELLKKIRLFDGLTDDELRQVRRICQEENAPKETVIFQEGSFGDKCHIVLNGEVRISKFIPGVGEEALAVLKPGDYFGEMALIDDFPRSAHAIANTDVELLTISKSEMDELLFFNKEIAYKMLWTFCRTLSARLRETNEKIAAFFAMSARF
ncbi:MAG: cyclic nucleotide-binding domain-containing protein [Nitrospirae bacterium]|nr:cyclic nucleotide-binding domain-containing protein [Nitrospirota bacterium]